MRAKGKDGEGENPVPGADQPKGNWGPEKGTPPSGGFAPRHPYYRVVVTPAPKVRLSTWKTGIEGWGKTTLGQQKKACRPC